MPKKSLFGTSAIDPTLDALFASSSGPVQPSKKPRYIEPVSQDEESGDDDLEESENQVDDEQLSELDEDMDSDASIGEDSGEGGEEDDNENEEADSSEPAAKAAAASELLDSSENNRKRKRKQADAHDDLETKYFQKVAAEEDEEKNRSKRSKKERNESTKDSADAPGGLIHESLLPDNEKTELDKAGRTVFLSNVSTEAITSKSAKKQLMAHLASVLDKEAKPPQTIESLRFRSVPVATAAMPKRAAVITEAVMDATTKSANAYVVYSDAAGARAAVTKLNGTMVLDRHLRTDSVAHPAPVDHRRCVFVGNLGFVDDETVVNVTVDEDGKQKEEKRKRTKVPMDVEEGLWRTFGKSAGKVENVRVVRDGVTRVGKGIAYVQFYDANSVEAALLLDGKKFPPLLPRALRVTRCKAPHKTARAMERATQSKASALANAGKPKSTKYVRKVTVEEKTGAGRAGKLLGRSAAARLGGFNKPRFGKGKAANAAPVDSDFKSPEEIIFEGHRASVKEGKPKDLKFKGSKVKKSKRPVSGNQKRRATRAANWKSKGST
ncbi:hypothetical protein MCOR27_011727 [Pyricularia oryzae]|uniref:Nucleolar protein 12 n=2 Tax=Pyricularia TaxID=48558 RepID=A0ABQ8N8S3_PYRGI|nr:hypothetical protein MCOR01_011236 [Pyricularia oryzae]KAI6291818.1 hypothetical protein MCOR33_010313 [Pyricularia grisea]KAH9437683.1 hypothetical protein MCOR02_001336 [Pyricularia oryzae]KAI6256601.1 hypothetical protein MCOR19_006971 [Pyricularia oryzae]KAI6264410.1 hypothetical protein MCOR27_011727 [Pyricularia oryzae]